jgi:hypothetical protein
MNNEIKLTEMQQFFLDQINKHSANLNPGYLAYLWYTRNPDSHHPVASRYAFGRTSAAYRTCRKLESLGLIKKLIVGSGITTFHRLDESDCIFTS